MALSGAVGLAVGVFPVLGVTTVVGLIFGFLFRLNHIALQVVNYGAQGLQILMIPVYMRFGDLMFGVEPLSFVPAEMKHDLLKDPKLFWFKFSGSMGRGVVLWLLTLPVLIAFSYICFLPIFKALRKSHASK